MITDIPGIKVGNGETEEALTGCTVVLTEGGAQAACDVRGGAPGTRELTLLRPGMLVREIHALLLTGGSAFGLEAAGGVMDYLQEKGVGFDTGVIPVPIVPAAVIFDLGVGKPAWPSVEMAYGACQEASQEFATGNAGVGCGATVGKLMGSHNLMKGGLGTASLSLPGGAKVGALMVVNTLGDVRDPENGKILAGLQENGFFLDSLQVMGEYKEKRDFKGDNTTIGVVATDVALNREELIRVASMAHDGLARTITPAHTMFDGDIIFALSLGCKEGDASLVGAMAAEAVARAVVQGIKAARPVGEIPSWQSLAEK